MEDGLEKYLERMKEEIKKNGLELYRRVAPGITLHDETNMGKVMPIIYPVVAEAVKEHGYLFASDFRGIGAFVFSSNDIAYLLVKFTQSSANTFGISVISLEDILKEIFGEFDKISSRGRGYRKDSKILYEDFGRLKEGINAVTTKRAKIVLEVSR